MSKLNIPHMDLSASIAPLRAEINQKLNTLIDATQFIGGTEVGAFEEEFATFCNVPYCVGCSNGTDAITLALKILGIGAGDEVIVPALSFIATSEAVTAAGAKVVFADVEKDTLTLAIAEVERLLANPKHNIKAIIPVHLYGHMANMPAIMEIAHKHQLKVIEDSAQAHGAKCQGKGPGEWGDCATFSFYPGKNLGAFGDAGALVMKDKDQWLHAKKLVNHGRWNAKYDHELEGYNMRMDTIQAAVLRIKLRHLAEWTQMRQQKASLFMNLLQGKQVELPIQKDQFASVWHLFVIRTNNRDSLMEHLHAQGVHAAIHYPIALPRLQAYQYMGHQLGDFPIAERETQRILSLPFWPEISNETMQSIANLI